MDDQLELGGVLGEESIRSANRLLTEVDGG
jgi:hypothetical protein